MPRAAALRKIAPTLVWSTMSSSTTTRRAPANTSASGVGGGRCMAAMAPRCRWNPVIAVMTSSLPTYTGTSAASAAATRSASSRTQRCAIR